MAMNRAATKNGVIDLVEVKAESIFITTNESLLQGVEWKISSSFDQLGGRMPNPVTKAVLSIVEINELDWVFCVRIYFSISDL